VLFLPVFPAITQLIIRMNRFPKKMSPNFFYFFLLPSIRNGCVCELYPEQLSFVGSLGCATSPPFSFSQSLAQHTNVPYKTGIILRCRATRHTHTHTHTQTQKYKITYKGIRDDPIHVHTQQEENLTKQTERSCKSNGIKRQLKFLGP
jgi:hypothetical protein